MVKVAAAVLVGVFTLTAALMAAGEPAVAGEPAAVVTETLTIRYEPADEVTIAPMVDELAPATVLMITATGFDPDETGSIWQCVSGSTNRCDNRLEVRFDGSGAARFQYLVTDEIGALGSAAGRCRLGGDRCTIELRSGDKVSVIDTIFVDRAPEPGDITVEPARNLALGDTVVVKASGFPAAAELTVTVCAAPATSGPRCGHPGPVVPLTMDTAGSAEAEVVLDVEEVGSDGVACGRRSACRVVVSSDEVGVRAAPTTLFFTDGPGADYVTWLVVIGVVAALGFLLLALWLVRSTNWDPPPEADSSAIDDAEYADLDLEAEQFEDSLA